jgi:hypothetical protein
LRKQIGEGTQYDNKKTFFHVASLRRQYFLKIKIRLTINEKDIKGIAFIVLR